MGANVTEEYGRVELVEGEQRNAVRDRLHAAARRRGLSPGPGPLIFCVEEVPIVDATPTVDAARAAAPAQRRQRQERRPAGRYDDGERNLPAIQARQISPTLVQRDFGRIIRQIGTPAQPPKRRGISAGRRLGTRLPPRLRQKVVVKGHQQAQAP